MGMPAARITDMHVCPMVTVLVPHVGGPIITGMPTVLTGMLPQARVTDLAICVGPPDMIVKGSVTVLVGGLPAARILDNTVHGGMIVTGLPTVLIGDAGAAGGGAAAPAPAPPANPNLDVARSLVSPGGSGTPEDAELVAQELAKVPKSILDKMKANGTKVIACRGNVTDYKTDLKGVHPRGWPPDSTWDQVPGSNMRDSNEVVIAVIGHDTPAGAHVPMKNEGHGSENMVVHESTHSIDRGGDDSSDGEDFKDARDADMSKLSDYEKQAGEGGPRETFAESAARHAEGKDDDTPNLKKYWDDRQ